MNVYSHRKPNGNGIGIWMIVLLALGVGVWRIDMAQAGQSSAAKAKALYQQALHEEDAVGNLKAAIALYERVVAAKPDRALAAQALVRMAECYRKLGDAESRKIYERVIREYADQKESAALAQSRLGGTDRATQQGGIALRKVWDVDASGTISQDGRRLSYNDYKSGNLALRDLAAGADRPLTSPDFNAGPSVISRDGTQVAYEVYGGKYGGELRLVSVQGNGVPPFRRLYENADTGQITPMDFSPDGKSIVVSLVRNDGTRQIGLVAVQNGSMRVLKSVDWRGPTRIFFSPDGHDLAFDLPVSESSDQRDVFVLAADGSRQVSAVVHPSNDIVMGWTPDGKHLLFASDRRNGAMGLWALAFAEGKPQGMAKLVKESIGSAWSMGVTSSGALYVGVGAGDRDISVASIDLTTGKQINPPVRPIQTFVGSNNQPAWSPDGKSLAYVSSRSSINNGRIIAIRSVDTGEVRELRPSLVYFNQMSWAPDGRTIATGGIDLKGRDGVFRIDAQTGEVLPIVLLPEAGYPQWSPDGERIYYRRNVGSGVGGDEWAFVERDLASGHEREVIRGDLGSINLSPDGRWIVAQKLDRSTKPGSEAVVLIPVEGGEPRELLRVSQPQRITRYTGMPWTPDGRGVIVRKRLTGGTSELWLVPIADAPPRKLDIDVNRWATGPVGVISLHPDGQRLAFTSGEVASEVWALENFLPALKASK